MKYVEEEEFESLFDFERYVEEEDDDEGTIFSFSVCWTMMMMMRMIWSDLIKPVFRR